MQRSLKSLVPAWLGPVWLGSFAPVVLGTLALGALVLFFLAGLRGPGGRWRLSSAGWLQDQALSRVDPPPRLLGRADPEAALRSEPWAALDRLEVLEGRAPLWNPWNACGRPHLANAGTTSCSPFALPRYLLDARAGAFASAALELFALALFAFLLLRQLGASMLAGILGATAFAFAGSSLHPLATGRAGALAALPASLYFAERALAALHRVTVGIPGERRTSARLRGPLAGLALTFAVGSLCGSPAALALAAAVSGAWVVARVSTIVLAARAAGRSLAPIRSAGVKTAIALAIAAGLASFRVLGWFELFAHAEIGPPPPPSFPAPELGPWPLLLFPASLGEAASATILPVHVGGIVLFLAIAALPFCRRDPRIAWFLAIAVLCLAVATGSAPVLRKLAAFGVPSDEVGQGGWALCIACAAALGVDRIARSDATRPWRSAVLVALGGLAFLAAFRLGLESLPGFDPSASAPHLRHMAVVFAAGIVAVCLLWVARVLRARLAAGAGLALSVFLGGGRVLQDSVPRCEERAAFAATPSILAVQKLVGADRLVVVGNDALPPDANVAYGIAVPTSRAGTELGRYARLFRSAFPGSDVRGPVESVSERALQTFGIRWVLAREPFEPARANPDVFRLAQRFGDLGLYRFARSLGRSWLVRRSVQASSEEEALAFVGDEAFDPARIVVLEADENAREDRRGPVDRLETALGASVSDLAASGDPPPAWILAEPTWIKLETECSSPSFLVLAQCAYPGWRARVNGIESPLRPANGAFVAVEVPRGLSVVELSYEPRSIEIGLWIAIASGLVGLLCLFHRPFA